MNNSYRFKKSLVAVCAVAAFIACSAFTCSTKDVTLIDAISSAAVTVGTIADPAIAPYLQLAQKGVNCATAPGTSQQVIDGCLQTALANYQTAWKNATPAEQILIATVIGAIEGYVNSLPNAPLAQAQVADKSAKTPTAKQFKSTFNAQAKKLGLKPI